MKTHIQWGAALFTYAVTAAEALATSASSPASSASAPPDTNLTPGGSITWFVLGLGIGLVVGYVLGKRAAATDAQRGAPAGPGNGTASSVRR